MVRKILEMLNYMTGKKANIVSQIAHVPDFTLSFGPMESGNRSNLILINTKIILLFRKVYGSVQAKLVKGISELSISAEELCSKSEELSSVEKKYRSGRSFASDQFLLEEKSLLNRIYQNRVQIRSSHAISSDEQIIWTRSTIVRTEGVQIDLFKYEYQNRVQIRSSHAISSDEQIIWTRSTIVRTEGVQIDLFKYEKRTVHKWSKIINSLTYSCTKRGQQVHNVRSFCRRFSMTIILCLTLISDQRLYIIQAELMKRRVEMREDERFSEAAWFYIECQFDESRISSYAPPEGVIKLS
ncbi:Serine-threonine protein kinase [Dorcoceras hygrometricum]|uniref:Serine-threonine protein kinase n=1 Tax=Dorcoceras hygrometricum TaxID=472368 RepID=A0A2Z7B583_9LAMI|nr:Serine-threonine protein kinase [Dorcoceras hygrometricum]